MPKATNKALDWAKKCAASNGEQILLTGEDKKSAEEFKKVIDSFKEKEEEFIKAQREFRLEVDTFWIKIKKNLYDSGVKFALEYDLDLDSDAIKDGHFVVNLTKPVPKNRF